MVDVMDRHIKWFEKIKLEKERLYFPIPEIFHMDPVIKSYEKGGDKGHLYIVKVPNEKGFKIGSTTQLIIRMYYYPIDTELLFCKKVDENLRKHEKRWITVLKRSKKFELYKGKEWFYGAYECAIELLNDILNFKRYEKLLPKEARIRRMKLMRCRKLGHYSKSIAGH